MSDLEFVQRCVTGDSLAWDEFLRRYSRLIYNYIFQILNSSIANSSKTELSAEIFQEIFLLLTKDNYRKLKTFQARNGCSFASWLRQVVLNYTIGYLRRQKIFFSLEEADEEGFSLQDVLADNRICVREGLTQEEIFSALSGCIEKLNKEEQLFLEMYLKKRMSPDELGKLFKVKRGAIDMRKLRIIENLKECFRRQGFM
ncbi:MAG: sigma-70 family RNA polymerase sigma factor [Candidatus Omnitrophica bacterium]|nr:sigma-70 family RNA polymerase sigma factor [Candidatus Omnitrophota bacterium]MDD5653666.1 sigma-70 family RNA polymerase sigma factor [Candidatus Omnitrophota bacterium]